MCGIGGASCAHNEQLDLRALARVLAIGLTPRGRDATGTAWTQPDGTTWYHKLPIVGTSYPAHVVDRDATQLLVHTRAYTQGSPAQNENNHPIVLPGIVGIHNGIVTNDRELFEMADAERTAEVDSEAIFAALGHRPSGVHPTSVLRKLQGDAAVAWFETHQPEQLRLARVIGRPLVIGQTRRGSTLFASTDAILHTAADKCRIKLTSSWEVPVGTYVRVKRGAIVEIGDIPGMAERAAAKVTYAPPTWDRYADKDGRYSYGRDWDFWPSGGGK